MYKRIKLLAITLLAIVSISIAQSTQKSWPQLTTFHSYMSSTFHPTEEGNFVPLKAKSDSMLIAAKLWQASPIPSNYKPAETKSALESLVKQCDKVNKAVKKNAADDELKKLISDAHDIFHHIVGECKKTAE